MEKNRYSRYYTYITPVFKNQAVKSFAPYIFSLLAIIFFAIFVIQPTVSTILSLNKSIADEQQVLNTLHTKAENLQQGKQNLAAISPAVKARITSLIPSDPAVTAIIKSLQNPRESSIASTIIQIQPLTLLDTSAPASPNALNEVSFNYNTQGNYSDLTAFLRTVNALPRLISVDSLTIGKQTGETLTSLSITGRAYYIH